MAFFRDSPEILDRFLSFRKFANYSNFIDTPKLLVDTEESEFSHFIFSEDDSFTFLTFEAMENTYDTAFISLNGVFYSSVLKDRILPDTRKALLPLVRGYYESGLTTFSEEGIEKHATVFTDGEKYEKALWFESKFATFVATGWSQPEELKQKVYLMRREARGPIVQRLEPRDRHLRHSGDIFVDECLYKHWQKEKHDGTL